NVRISPLDYEDVESIISDVHDIGTNKKNEETPMQQQLSELLQAVPELKKEINAMLVLAHAGERVVRPIFSRTDAVGSVMRRKLEPVSKLMMEQFSVLNS
ncbi:MAG: hypothetical protein KAS48_01740, partial [Gammaproteobacteria bacterium]|nr:hypothetical protein [Gammaproteobacteria bacterium]